MAYKIYYPTVGKRKYPLRTKLPKWAYLTGTCCIIAITLVLICVWQGSASWLLPGDPSVTGPALQTLIDRLTEGEALGDAVTAFCREVVAGAG